MDSRSSGGRHDRRSRPRGNGDSVEGLPGDRPFEVSATAWLVGQAIRFLNTAGEEGEVGYERVATLLRNCGDADATMTGLLQIRSSGDACLRWNLLRVFGDVATPAAAEFLADAALEPVPEPDRRGGCKGPRDAELLVRTAAVHALRRTARRHPEAAEHLLRVVSERPDRAVVIEAVKAAADVGEDVRVREALAEEDRSILEIRRARREELYADPEREDPAGRVPPPPNIYSEATAPRAGGCARKEC